MDVAREASRNSGAPKRQGSYGSSRKRESEPKRPNARARKSRPQFDEVTGGADAKIGVKKSSFSKNKKSSTASNAGEARVTKEKKRSFQSDLKVRRQKAYARMDADEIATEKHLQETSTIGMVLVLVAYFLYAYFLQDYWKVDTDDAIFDEEDFAVMSNGEPFVKLFAESDLTSMPDIVRVSGVVSFVVAYYAWYLHMHGRAPVLKNRGEVYGAVQKV